MLNKYKNPYIIPRYKGIDWASYITYKPNQIYTLDLSKNLSIVSLQINHTYKIYNNDFIHILEGQLLIDDYKRIHSNFTYHCPYTSYALCRGKDTYNTFFHYKS